jgi:hypothetical protein
MRKPHPNAAYVLFLLIIDNQRKTVLSPHEMVFPRKSCWQYLAAIGD